MHWKRATRDVQAVLLTPTAARRPPPDFLIIGAMKAGTTSLFSWLSRHPAVLPARRKEVHYFDRQPLRSFEWYRTFFATERQRASVGRRAGAAITGEATPAYMCAVGAAEQVRAALPGVRAIALLREPASRAWSHFRHEQRAGREHRRFADAVAADLAGVAAGSQRRAGYYGRGLYAELLRPWSHALGDRLLVVFSVEVFGQPNHEAPARILEFLQLPAASMPALPRLNTARTESAAEVRDTIARLHEAYLSSNSELAELLGRDLPW